MCRALLFGGLDVLAFAGFGKSAGRMGIAELDGRQVFRALRQAKSEDGMRENKNPR